MSELADRMINYRAKYSLSQEAFASFCKVHRNTINFIEHGGQPRETTQRRIELILQEGGC